MPRTSHSSSGRSFVSTRHATSSWGARKRTACGRAPCASRGVCEETTLSRRILQYTQVVAQRRAAGPVPPLMTDEKYGSVTEIMSYAPARLVEILRDDN